MKTKKILSKPVKKKVIVKKASSDNKSLSMNEINKKYFWDFIKKETKPNSDKKMLFSVI